MIAKIGDVLERQKSMAPLLLRLALAATFMVHGYGKVFGGNFSGVAEGIAGAFGIPVVFGYLVGIGEFFGGLGLLVGFLTRFCAGSIGLIMIGAIIRHAIMAGQTFKMGAMATDQGPRMTGWEWQTLLLAAAVALVFTGGGAFSADALIKKFVLKKKEE